MSDDDYDFYYDETDEMFEDEYQGNDFSPIATQCSQFPNDEKSALQRLSSDVVLANILPFICQKKTLSTLATVSKHFKQILFSDIAEELWNQRCEPFRFCIDTYCPACIIKKRQQKGSMHGVLGGLHAFFEKCPIKKVNLHCFITDIPGCLMALSTKKTLKELDLTLSNKSNSPPLEDLLAQSNFFPLEGHKQNSSSFTFPQLRELTLDSTHLQHVNLAGRARLLDILGSNLESLSFSGLSPAGVFSILSCRCPKLLKLRVDKVTAAQDILSYKNKSLKELELRRAAFLLYPGCLSNFPSLNSVKYTPSFRCDSAQVEGVINALPSVLFHLSLEIPSKTGDDVLNAVSKRLHIIQSLDIQGSHELGTLSADALLNLGRKCLFLSSLGVTSTKSVSDMCFSSGAAFMMLSSFPSLKKLRVKYDEVSIGNLRGLLTQSDSLREIILWERKKWIQPKMWSKMQLAVEAINTQFPHCSVVLENTV